MASLGRILHLSENLTLPFDRRVWMELNALAGAGYPLDREATAREPVDAEE